MCGSRLENPLSPFLFQFQEMLKQYEENLNNERIEKTRLSENYESKIQMLTSVRNQVNFQPTIFSRAFLTQVSVMNLITASPSSEKITHYKRHGSDSLRLPLMLSQMRVISRFILWNVTKNTVTITIL